MDSKDNDPLAPDIRELIQKLSCDAANKTLFEEILTTLCLLAKEHKDQGDFKLIHTVLNELRDSFKVFKAHRKIRKVAIFGSGRVEESDRNYQLAQNLAEDLVKNKFQVISGAGGGIMEAINRGASNSFGLNIKLPHEQVANPYIYNSPQLIEFKYFFTRKLVFIKESHATVLLPGGFGTLDEGFENLTLLQNGKCMPRPLILLDHEDDDFWDRWLDLLNTGLVKKGFASAQDQLLIKRAHSSEEALDHILSFYRVFHSLRYVRGKTVLRLNAPASSQLLEKLNQEFQDILVQGKIECTDPLKEEKIAREHLDLPRITLHFDKKSFGRLHLLIDRLNQS